MTDIRVIDLFGPICVDSDDGAKLHQLIHQALNRGETVCLDFDCITTLTSSFLSVAVGRLYSCFNTDDLDRRLRWKGLDPVDEGMMRLIQRNAIRFYSATESQQEALLSSAVRAMEE